MPSRKPIHPASLLAHSPS